MSEEILENTEQPSLVPSFKSMCLRVGAMMIVVFAVRCICSIILALAAPLYRDWGGVEKTLLSSLSSIVFLNVIPITAGIFILKFPLKSGVKAMYAKPRYFGRALGMFPAGYGAAITMSLLTILLGKLFVGTPVEDSFNATQNMFASSNMTSAVILFVHTTILAPLFEEFWFRGLVLQSLRPYGNGFAIFISALLFGLTHANLSQFFYATTVGIILGYVAVQTGSVITTTVMHAMFNGIAGITSLLMANESVADYMIAVSLGQEAVKTPVVTFFLVWLILVIMLALVGFVMAIVKLVHIKRYRVPQMQTEMSMGKRWGIFISRPTVVIMLLMGIDTMTFAYVTNKLIDLLAEIFS